MNHRSFMDHYRKHVKLLFFLADRYGVPIQEAEEIIQETFVKLWKEKPPVPQEKVKSYLVVLLRNAIINRFRSADQRLRKEVEDFNSYASEAEFADLANRKDALLSSISTILSEFSQKEKDGDIFKLYYSDGLSIREIASRKAISESNVKVKIHRFRNKFKKTLKERLTKLEELDCLRNTHEQAFPQLRTVTR